MYILLLLSCRGGDSRAIEQIKPFSLSRNTIAKLQKFRVSENKKRTFFVEREKFIEYLSKKNVQTANDSDKTLFDLLQDFLSPLWNNIRVLFGKLAIRRSE